MSQRATVTTTDGITLITMPNVPADIDFVAKIFENIASLGINVDMISLTPPQGANIDLSFTISDDDLGKLLAYNAERRSKGRIKHTASGIQRELSDFCLRRSYGNYSWHGCQGISSCRKGQRRYSDHYYFRGTNYSISHTSRF